MKTAIQFLTEAKPEFAADFNREMTEAGSVKMTTFVIHDLPMIVHCTDCEMTFVITNGHIDDNGYTFCSTCAAQH